MEEKVFMTKNDIKKIFKNELTEYKVAQIFKEIRRKALEDLGKKKMILPDKSHVPATYVWDYVKAYGIER